MSALRMLGLPLLLTALGGCDRSAEVPAHLTVSGGDVRIGEQLVTSYGCGACHVIPKIRGANSHVGPPLNQFGRRSFIGGHLPNSPDNLVRWIMDPPAIAPGTAMPNLGIPREQARHIAAYLYTLR